MALLEIKNLNAGVGEKQILKDFSFEIEAGKVYAIMGPNGSGKSTLSNVIAGNPAYEVTSGKMMFKGKDLSQMTPDVRANEGIFLGFQYPIEIPGISYAQFLKQALTSKMKYLGQKPLDAVGYIKRLKVRAQALGVTDEMLKRPVNVGFSGGEKKRMETLQMAFLEPDFCILDEMDSGLDVDALKVVADGVNLMRSENRSFLLITHYERLLDLIEPDVIYIMVNGHIVDKGDKSLAGKLEERGYADYK
ncbi:MAG: Fe-S cluster assembly ATPase SufC [Alphaproteobacteria bacterium]|nr:Fe-S cluster assembly ATPase SufC [Alphaproteobacteria bacterium]